MVNKRVLAIQTYQSSKAGENPGSGKIVFIGQIRNARSARRCYPHNAQSHSLPTINTKPGASRSKWGLSRYSYGSDNKGLATLTAYQYYGYVLLSELDADWQSHSSNMTPAWFAPGAFQQGGSAESGDPVLTKRKLLTGELRADARCQE